jgi:hypothetical protein
VPPFPLALDDEALDAPPPVAVDVDGPVPPVATSSPSAQSMITQPGSPRKRPNKMTVL